MPVDPRLNCAAEICCSPPQALQATIEILCECGVADEHAPKIARALKEKGVALLPAALANVIREIAFPEKE